VLQTVLRAAMLCKLKIFVYLVHLSLLQSQILLNMPRRDIFISNIFALNFPFFLILSVLIELGRWRLATD